MTYADVFNNWIDGYISTGEFMYQAECLGATELAEAAIAQYVEDPTICWHTSQDEIIF